MKNRNNRHLQHLSVIKIPKDSFKPRGFNTRNSVTLNEITKCN